jgi:hypothetical protein
MKKYWLQLLVLMSLVPAFSFADSGCTYNGAGEIINTAQCYMTPQSFYVTIYKLGLCTANPEQGASPDFSSCTMLVDGPGQQVQLAPGTKILLRDMAAPPNGTYRYGVMVASNSIGLIGTEKYSVAMVGSAGGSGTTCWTVSGTVKHNLPVPTLVACGTTPSPAVTTTQINDFPNGSSLDPSNGGSFNGRSNTDNVSGGTIFAQLATDSLADATLTDWTNGSISHIVSVETFSNPVKITPSTSSLNIGFNVTNAMSASITGGGGTGFGGALQQYAVSAFAMQISAN